MLLIMPLIDTGILTRTLCVSCDWYKSTKSDSIGNIISVIVNVLITVLTKKFIHGHSCEVALAMYHGWKFSEFFVVTDSLDWIIETVLNIVFQTFTDLPWITAKC